MIPEGFPAAWEMAVWGLAATVVMATIMHSAQGMGYSRLSLPFLAGTMFTADRRFAMALGFGMFIAGGWAFTFLYFLLFASLGTFTWWLGAAIGFLHGLFLLACGLPLLPWIHPRMASEHGGASAVRQLQPPGFLGLNYGSGTPLSALAGQTAYGLLLGGLPQMQTF